MHLTIIAKAPVPGLVKSRLCPPCTPQQAADIALVALCQTIAGVDAVADLTARRHPAAPPIRKTLLLDGAAGEWAPPDYDVVPQRGEGLAERLAHGFAELGPGLIVGMDTPVAVGHLQPAIEAIEDGFDVIGLAVDGGYWVIGLAEPDEAVFEDIPMSTSHTGLAQLRRLHQLGRPVRHLPMARDLDDIDDLNALAASERADPLASIARRVLAALR